MLFTLFDAAAMVMLLFIRDIYNLFASFLCFYFILYFWFGMFRIISLFCVAQHCTDLRTVLMQKKEEEERIIIVIIRQLHLQQTKPNKCLMKSIRASIY